MDQNNLNEIVANKNDFLIATIGELREHKGQEDFIKAACLVSEQLPGVRFLIVGKDNSKDERYKSCLDKLVKDLEMDEKVIFTGWQNNISEVYSVIDVFVSASRSEPFGLVIAEAMASGKAIIATNTIGSRELIENNETGKIVPIADAEAIAGAMLELLRDKGKRDSFGKRAKFVAQERFSLESMTAETERIYETVLRESKSRKRIRNRGLKIITWLTELRLRL